MEENKEALKLLELIVPPAFCVREGTVVYRNQAAQRHMIEPGTEISNLLAAGKQEYADFTGGCLYVTLSISGQIYGATATRMEDGDIFVLDQDETQAELQAMALAAQELRRPLASIMAVADQLLPAISAAGDSTAQEQAARINRSLSQLLRIVGNMSDASRCQSISSPELRDICAILEEIFAKASALVAHANVHLTFTGLPERIFTLVDEDLLERAVYNIVSNSVKFMPQGGSIAAKLIRRRNKLYLVVQDNGQGIPDAIRSSVYFRYRREPAIEDGRFGLGLGMVLIRSAAIQHGGTVLMEQPESGGTRLTMTLEIRQPEAGTLRSPVFKVDYAGEREHILIELSDALPVKLYKKEAEH